MKCVCGRLIKVTKSIKSRVRKEPYEYTCKCGKVKYITAEDISEYYAERLADMPPYKKRRR